MTKYSVIIPVYNVESYIYQCVNSVVSQTYKNIEIILVDDGSPDKCPKICDEIANKDSRVKVIHKENGGLSSARNEGLKLAKGDYIVFVDSDDWLDNEYIEKINNVIMNRAIDVVVVKVKSYFEDNNLYQDRFYNLNEGIITGTQAFGHLYSKTNFWGAAWQFVVKKEFLIENNLEFIEGIYHEDERYSPELLLSADKVAFSSQAYYINRAGRHGSITNSLNIKKEFDKLFIIKDLLSLTKSPKFSGVKGKLLAARCTQIYLGLIKSSSKYSKNNKSESKELNLELLKMKYVLKFNKKLKYKLLYIFVSVLGVKATGEIINKKR